MKWPIYLSAVCPQSDAAKSIQSGHQFSQFPIKALITTTMLIVLTGCASKPVVNPVQSRLVVIPQYYTVQAGDTLSKIAARYNLDYRDIARLNNIDSSYIIYRNQSIRLHSGGKDAPRIQVRTAAVATPIQTQSLPSQPIRPQPVVRNTAPVSRPTTVTSNPAITPSLGNVPAVVSGVASGLSWQWPTSGAVIQQFDLAKDVKGVRIGGVTGNPILAAADGEVVYASDRLTEYGNLVLIRHINGYVTAYAHNSKILVKETDRVKAGQKIAEMGSSGASQTMLEFQVRLNGKPINPVGLLPAR